MVKNENLIRKLIQTTDNYSYHGIWGKVCTGCNYEWKKHDVTKCFSQYHLPKDRK